MRNINSSVDNSVEMNLMVHRTHHVIGDNIIVDIKLHDH